MRIVACLIISVSPEVCCFESIRIEWEWVSMADVYELDLSSRTSP